MTTKTRYSFGGTGRLAVALAIMITSLAATAAEIIDPNLDDVTYTIDGTSGNGTVSGNSVLTNTVTLKQGLFVEYLVVGGGAGGGGGHGGGGGAGGYLEGTSYQVTPQSYTVVVGNGGSGGLRNGHAGGDGQSSRFDTIIASGGGGGASRDGYHGRNGASGGGASRDGGNPGSTTNSAQGNNGGLGVGGPSIASGGGGGGASATGGAAVGAAAGAGGTGKTSAITGFETGYAGGGGGGRWGTNGSEGSATHGGGAGANHDSLMASPGLANTGGGGGGGGSALLEGTIAGSVPNFGSGARGGSGIVVVRYQGTTVATGGTVAENPGSATGYTVHSFTTLGTSAFNLSGVDLATRLGATITGDLSGSGSLVYDGPGTLTLAGANTYTGDMTISAGTLVLGSTGELRFTLNDGGLGNQIVGTGGAIILDGTLRLESSALTDPDGVWNLIDLDSFGVGNLTFDDDFALALVGEPSFANLGGGLYSYLSGKSLWEFSESTGALTLTQIPEPTSLALLGLAGLALLRRRR